MCSRASLILWLSQNISGLTETSIHGDISSQFSVRSVVPHSNGNAKSVMIFHTSSSVVTSSAGGMPTWLKLCDLVVKLKSGNPRGWRSFCKARPGTQNGWVCKSLPHSLEILVLSSSCHVMSFSFSFSNALISIALACSEVLYHYGSLAVPAYVFFLVYFWSPLFCLFASAFLLTFYIAVDCSSCLVFVPGRWANDLEASLIPSPIELSYSTIDDRALGDCTKGRNTEWLPFNITDSIQC